jgi:hypothetical protein
MYIHIYIYIYILIYTYIYIGPGLGLGEFGGESAEGQKTSKKKDSDSADLLGEEVKPRAKLPPLLTPLRYIYIYTYICICMYVYTCIRIRMNIH